MVGEGKQTGYEIKTTIERSTRFFFGASYGTIYPDLRLLEARGLVEASDAPRGGRRRRAYRLTPAGEATLEEWLRSSEDGVFDLRDELLTRLFFAGRLSAEDRLDLVCRLRRRHERELDALEATEREHGPRIGEYQRLCLKLGLEVAQLIVDWARRTEDEIARA